MEDIVYKTIEQVFLFFCVEIKTAIEFFETTYYDIDII